MFLRLRYPRDDISRDRTCSNRRDPSDVRDRSIRPRCAKVCPADVGPTATDSGARVAAVGGMTLFRRLRVRNPLIRCPSAAARMVQHGCSAMTSPRIIVSGATTAITRRTTLRKAFLGPWDPMVQQCWLYALADAQRHTEAAVHHGFDGRDPHYQRLRDEASQAVRLVYDHTNCVAAGLVERACPGQISQRTPALVISVLRRESAAFCCGLRSPDSVASSAFSISSIWSGAFSGSGARARSQASVTCGARSRRHRGAIVASNRG